MRIPSAKSREMIAAKSRKLADNSREMSVNALNRAQLPAPNTDPRNALFGEIRANNQANYPRRIQLTAKFIF